MNRDPIAMAISEAFGERCPDFSEDCMTCRAWAEYDRIEQLETDLEKARKALELIAAPASFLLSRKDALKMRDTARITLQEISR